MPYSIDILRDAEKFLSKLATQQRKDAVAIEDAIETLSVDPRQHGCKPLTGYRDVFGFGWATTGSATRSTMVD